MGKAERCGVRVVARFRPLSKSEIERGDAEKKPFRINNKAVVDHESYTLRQYVLDQIVPEATQQEQVYQVAASETVEEVLKGYNGTLFAYGQTGAGKSYTMFGADSQERRGIIPRAVERVCQFATDKMEDYLTSPTEDAVATVELQCSFFQIYNEQVLDLLSGDMVGLPVRQSVQRGVYVEGLTELMCKSTQEVLELIEFGESNRVVSATAMNAESSRSHSVFCIQVHQKSRDGFLKSTSKLYMADLAGSERISRSKVSGDGLQEALAINSSLTALGKCIKALTESGRSHIPFRESKLTYILQDSLAGNSKTTLIVALSPHVSNHDETVATLQFAERCKLLKNKVVKSKIRSAAELEALVEQLSKELEGLKAYNKLLEAALKAAGLPLPDAAAAAEAMEQDAARLRAAEEAEAAAKAALAAALAKGDPETVAKAQNAVAEAEAALAKAEVVPDDEGSHASSIEVAEMKVEFDMLKQQNKLQTDELASVVADAEQSRSEFESTIADQTKQMEELRKQISELEDAKANAENELSDATHKLAQAEGDAEKTLSTLCQKSGRVKVLEKEAEQLRAQLGDVEAQCLILTTEIAISKEREQSAKDDMEHNVEAVTSTLTESLAKANNVQREQAASLSQLEARVEELEAELTQAEAATQLERNRVQELEDKNRHESTGTAGYKQAFQAMLENEKVIEADVAKKDAQIFALQQQVQLLEIQIRWGTQRRRTLSQVSPNLESCSPIIDGEADLLGEGVHHFETEQWEKKMFGRSRWQPGSQEWRDQPPPEGYEWGSPWQIDGTHTAVDPEGWSYGSTEQELTERRQAGASNTSKAKEDMYRTRKWVRSMVLKLSV